MGRVGTDARLINIYWSEELLAEAAAALKAGKDVSNEVATRWVDRLRTAFPDGHCDISTVDPEIELASLTSDPNDEHVCALALAAKASYLFTFDDGYDGAALQALGIRVQDPDDFLVKLIEEEPDVFAEILPRQAASWSDGKTVEELLDALERARCPRFAASARDLRDR